MDYQKRIDWTNSLKPGDRVAIRNRGVHDVPTFGVYKIKQVQKSRIVMECGVIVRRRRDGYPQDNIEPYTREIADCNERAGILAGIRGVEWHEVPIDVLREVWALVEDYVGKS